MLAAPLPPSTPTATIQAPKKPPHNMSGKRGEGNHDNENEERDWTTTRRYRCAGLSFTAADIGTVRVF